LILHKSTIRQFYSLYKSWKFSVCAVLYWDFKNRVKN
jgi:hypothetical protein